MLGNNSKIYVDHKQASVLWPTLLDDNVTLITSNYVVSETVGLLQNRIGFQAAKLWYKDILGVMDVWWVDASGEQAVKLYRQCELRYHALPPHRKSLLLQTEFRGPRLWNAQPINHLTLMMRFSKEI